MSTQIKGKGQGAIKNNNIEQTVRSSNEKTTKELTPGKNVTTMAGGILYPIMYKPILAGEYLKKWDIDNLLRLLTPLVPTLDKFFVTIQAYFVPHMRIWENAEKKLAGKEDAENRLGNNSLLPYVQIPAIMTQKARFRDTLVARYGVPNNSGNTTINILGLRGYRAIYNDYIRNKDYEMPKQEWKDDGLIDGGAEEASIKVFNTTTGENLPQVNTNNAYVLEAAPTRKNYFTNIKSHIDTATNIDADDNYTGTPPEYTGEASYIRQQHLDWQAKFQDAKQRSDNANKNDWEIIAEMGGTSPVRTDRVEFLGEVDFEMNFQQITQSAPVIDNSTPLGTTGSFSYTKATGTLFEHKEFKQHGMIHILAFTSIEKLSEKMIPKEMLITDVNDIYRPGLAKKEIQVLLDKEIDAHATSNGKALAYQPPWAEYKRLPNFVSGEMQSDTLEAIGSYPEGVSNAHWHNIPPSTHTEVITADYFKPVYETNVVLARNNVLDIATPTPDSMKVDAFMNISLHRVTTAQPIEESILDQRTKAEKDR